MAPAQLNRVLRHLRRLVGPAGPDQAPDRQLLRQFAAQRDEAAFARLTHVGLTPRRPPSGATPKVAGPTMTVTGRVIDAAGKAVAGAFVAVVGWAKSPLRTHPLNALPRVLAQGRADGRGRFRLTAP
jgi:hypothetical protein